MISNVNERYGTGLYQGNGNSLVASVNEDIAKIIRPAELYDLREVIGFYIRAYSLGNLKRQVQHAIAVCPPREKQVVGAFLRLYELHERRLEGAVELGGFLESCSLAFGVAENIAGSWLVGLGMINAYYYHSVKIKHLSWDMPAWAHAASAEIVDNPRQFGISVFASDDSVKEMKDPQAKDLVRWVYANAHSGLIEVYNEWTSGKRGYDKEHGEGAFDRELGRLVKVGGVAMMSATGRKTTDYSIHINPEALILL